jgi:uncharacterized protein YlxW (UPF0749 family)
MPDAESRPDGPDRVRAPRRPLGHRGAFLVAALVGLLGFALAVTVRTERTPAGLASVPQSDLVQLLSQSDQRSQQLDQELTALQAQAQQLRTSGDNGIALAQAEDRLGQLEILAGTVGAQGSGVTLRILDPMHNVTADVLVDALEELRDAGAEAMQIGPVRVVTSTFVLDTPRGVDVDGVALTAPYSVTAIGDPHTLAAALAIPGGVIATVDARTGARALLTSSALVRVTAVRAALPSR